MSGGGASTLKRRQLHEARTNETRKDITGWNTEVSSVFKASR